MKKPLLSICLITYNQARYVKESIDSILMQKVEFEWELIIADDCSTDGTQEILQAYKKKHPERIKLILRSKNVGPEENWLGLMDAAKSKYVLYGEGDDYFTDPTKLQRQVDFLEAHKDFAICFHPVKVVYEDGSKPDELFPSAEQRFHKDVLGLKDLLTNNFIQTNSAMYRWRYTKESIKATYPWGVSPGDWFLHILHAEKGKIGFLDRTMSVYRRHAQALWWDARHDTDKFWGKYGLPWLKLYLEFLKRYGSNPEYRPIVESSIINLFNSLIEVDKKGQSNLFHAALSASPEAADIYIQNLREQITNLHNHADEQAKIIEHYANLSQNLKRRNTKLESKILIRLESALKQRMKGKRH